VYLHNPTHEAGIEIESCANPLEREQPGVLPGGNPLIRLVEELLATASGATVILAETMDCIFENGDHQSFLRQCLAAGRSQLFFQQQGFLFDGGLVLLMHSAVGKAIAARKAAEFASIL
jgi:hypothetical protein